MCVSCSGGLRVTMCEVNTWRCLRSTHGLASLSCDRSCKLLIQETEAEPPVCSKFSCGAYSEMTVLERKVKVSTHLGKLNKKKKKEKQTRRGKYNYRYWHNLCNLFVCLCQCSPKTNSELTGCCNQASVKVVLRHR